MFSYLLHRIAQMAVNSLTADSQRIGHVITGHILQESQSEHLLAHCWQMLLDVLHQLCHTQPVAISHRRLHGILRHQSKETLTHQFTLHHVAALVAHTRQQIGLGSVRV